MRVLGGGWEVDRGLDQVFVEQPQQRKVPSSWRTNSERIGFFVCAMMHFADCFAEPLLGVYLFRVLRWMFIVTSVPVACRELE
jgi:hypothetical protein